MYSEAEAITAEPPEKSYTEHALYRYFDADGNLLYVGISLSAVARAVQHKAASEWYSKAVRMDIQRFESRDQLRFAEVAAIRKERPKFNSRHNTGDWDVAVATTERTNAKQMRVGLLRDTIKLVYSEYEVQNLLQLKGDELEELLKAGHIRFFLGTGGYSQKLNARKRVRLFSGWEVMGLIEHLEGRATQFPCI
jgi:hypothetical protein